MYEQESQKVRLNSHWVDPVPPGSNQNVLVAIRVRVDRESSVRYDQAVNYSTGTGISISDVHIPVVTFRKTMIV
jgi:hypothetical protein